MTAIVWFRRDLRLRDNPALTYSLAHHEKVVPVFINDSGDEEWSAGGASRWYLHQSLKALTRKLNGLGLRLHLRSGQPLEVLSAIAAEHKATHLYWNALPEPAHAEEDLATTTALSASGITTRSFQDYSLFPLGTVRKDDDSAYRVFTPFWRNLSRKLIHTADPSGLDSFMAIRPNSEPVTQTDEELLSLGLLDSVQWWKKLEQHWEAGEDAALRALDEFVEENLDAYPKGRDILAGNHCSRLSPALHFGEISPWRIVSALRPAFVGEWGSQSVIGAEAFLRQLGWREFSINLLNEHPHSATQSLQPGLDNSPLWFKNDAHIKAWQRGETGHPVIDAAMNELWETGYMHNRMRMVVASFLTKNLGQHWIHGARWFWDTLVDADLANNTMGWQWVAGSGCDAAPYYRIFNPDRQAEKFDPKGEYLNRWSKNQLIPPIVDLKKSREDALSRYKSRNA